jgi:hypothetical protein
MLGLTRMPGRIGLIAQIAAFISCVGIWAQTTARKPNPKEFILCYGDFV